MSPIEQANIKAIKNALCRIEDNLTKVFIDKKNPEKTVRAIMKERIALDKCVELLEKLLK